MCCPNYFSIVSSVLTPIMSLSAKSQEETTTFTKAVNDFYDLWPRLTFYHDETYKILMILGIIGGVLGLGTMIANKYMQVTSFLYHKVLVGANLIFCINWMILHLVDTRLSVEGAQFVFFSRAAAFYSGILQRVITSAAGYVWMYMSMLLALDRSVALGFPRAYDKFSSKTCCYSMITLSLLLSIGLHSWAPWLERYVYAENTIDNQTNFKWKKDEDGIPEKIIVVKVWYWYWSWRCYTRRKFIHETISTEIQKCKFTS